MKKTYIYLLSLLSTLPLSCMEVEMQVQPKNAYSQKIFASNMWGDLIPVYTNQPQQQNNICTANETGWEQLNKIAVGPYTSNSTHNSANDLKPIYHRTTKTVKTEEKQTLLPKTVVPKTLPLKSDYALMLELYNDAYSALYDTNNHHLKNQLTFNKELKTLIDRMAYVKNQQIDEDRMAKFAYEKLSLNFDTNYIAFLFYCIKKYNKIINENPEKIPSKNTFTAEIMSHEDSFLKTLGLDTMPITLHTQDPLSTTQTLQKEHPAYNNLIVSLQSLTEYYHSELAIILSFLHSTRTLITETNNSYYDLKKMFYEKAHTILRIKNNINNYTNSNNFYDLLEIVEQIKKDPTKQELDLGHDIFFAQEEEKIIEKVINYFKPSSYSTPYAKNLICLFCKLIEDYNKQRGNKTTPTDEQNYCYNQYKKINFELPNTFDKSLFDTNTYALIGLNTLMLNTMKLLTYSTENIDKMAHAMYPKKD